MPVSERSAAGKVGTVRVHAGSLVRAVAASVAFLTRVPLPARVKLHEDDVLPGAIFFPLVGALLGAVLGGAAVFLAVLVPPLVAGALAVALELAVTGALHLDGLADSADGLAGRDRPHRLAIMRDHALGTYGVCALALDLLIKAMAMGALAAGGAPGAILVVAAVFAVSRAAPLPLAAALPYARSGQGTGLLLTRRLGRRRAAAGITLAAVITATMAVAGGAAAVSPIACLLVVTAAVGLVCYRRLGGVTGDVMGAAIEITATLGLVVAVGVRG